MSHSHTSNTASSPSIEDLARQRRAMRLMILTLVPIAVFTLGFLIILWPGNVKDHIRQDVGTYQVEGVSVVTGRVAEITEISCDGVAGSTQAPGGPQQVCGKARVEMVDGPEQGQVIDDIMLKSTDYQSGVSVGQKMKLYRVPLEGQPAQYQFRDFDRSLPMIVFSLAFVLAVVGIARLRGLLSLLGLLFAGFILTQFTFPALVAGANPTMIGLVSGCAIMFVVLYAAHGFSARTTTALLGTLFGLFLSAALGWLAVKWAHLTGVASEDDMILSSAAPDLKMTSVVICGVMIAGLGVLNDVTITQASSVWELADADSNSANLFRRAMRIGRDHIASTVYTIAFATAGATLSTMLLLTIYQRPLFEVLQTEQFAQEVIRTVVGSIGLILSVPLTTAIGVAVVAASKKPRGEISMVTDGPAVPGPGDELIDKRPSRR